jgi:hypothetical protein
MKRFFLLSIFIFGLFFVFPDTVNAQCGAGYSCDGRTVVDFPAGCNGPFGSGASTYCTQRYSRGWVNCDSDCKWSANVGGWCNGCSGGGTGNISTNCCSGGSTGGGGGEARNCSGGWTTECKKNCNPAYREGGCGTGSDGQPKYDCRVRTCSGRLPDPPVLVSPGNTTTATGNPVTLDWNPITWGTNCSGDTAANVNRFWVYVGLDSAAMTRIAILGESTTSYPLDVTGYAPGTRIYWKVWSSNGCTGGEEYSPTWWFVTAGGVSGNVYFDPTNQCLTTQRFPGYDMRVSDGVRIATVADGVYQIGSPPGTHNLTLSNVPGGYGCSPVCGSGCTIAGVTAPSSTPRNFWVTNNFDPWWKVVDSDVSTNGSLDSKVPGGKTFGDAGPGGYPGVPAYATTTNISGTLASPTRWISQSTMSNPRVFDYEFFENQIPSDTLFHELPSNNFDQATLDANTTPSYGYYWYKFNGGGNALDVNINSAINVGSKKAILLLDSADLNINAPVSLTDGQGFFLVIVGKNSDGGEGDIAVSPSVGNTPYDLEGLYLAESEFSTGVAAIPLTVRGSVIAYDGVNLDRDLGPLPNYNAAEIFVFAPDQILLFPTKLGHRKLNWKEVAP